MTDGMRIALISAGSAIVGGLLVAGLNYLTSEREVAVKMIEIAVGLIRQPPSDEVQPAREWAVNVIEYYSDVKLSQKARAALLKCPLDLSDKFGRIGAAAMEKAPGLGGEILPVAGC